MHLICKYKNTTFVNILLIDIHYKHKRPFLIGGGGGSFLATPCIFTIHSRDYLLSRLKITAEYVRFDRSSLDDAGQGDWSHFVADFYWN